MAPSTRAATGSSGTATIDPGVSRQTVAAVPKVCRALAEPLVVSGDCRVVRTLDLRQHEPAIDHQAERDVGGREVRSGRIRSVGCEVAIQKSDLPGQVAPSLLDEPRMIPRWLAQLPAQERPEQSVRDVIVDPGHPLLAHLPPAQARKGYGTGK